MWEIGDFSAFYSPKQLFTYLGLDPAVKQSGKFEDTKISATLYFLSFVMKKNLHHHTRTTSNLLLKAKCDKAT